MIIVGIGGFFHDFNAAAVDTRTGRISAAEEERFSRKKHHKIMGAPTSSYDCIRHCLAEIGKGFEDVDVLVHSDEADHPLKAFLAGLFPNAKVAACHHHVSHAYAAWGSSGMEDAAVLVLDGFGDGKSGLLGRGHGTRIEPLAFWPLEDSIGLEFLRATFQLGLGSFGSEGKTQGLAAYGEPRFFDAYMNEITLNDDGTARLSGALRNMDGFIAGEHYVDAKILFNDFILDHINRRFSDEPLEQEHMDFAASAQAMLNAVALHAATALKRQTGCRNLVVGGGVALNSTMNGVLIASGLFDTVYAHPSASDRGNGLGAALWYLGEVMGEPSPLKEPLIYTGQAFTRAEIEAAVAKAGLSGTVLADPARTAAGLMVEGHIVGWFQGRSELGARALGDRSILADPRVAENKDILNRKVKHREGFRPFAPSVLDEHGAEWFALPCALPYMTMTADVLPEKRALVPTITHVDGSARVQTVRKDRNPKYHEVISAFHALTGVPMVVNTSFNDSGDPIVETPADAIDCFLKSDLDCVIMEDVLITKPHVSV